MNRALSFSPPLSSSSAAALDAGEICARTLAEHSKSFALAGKLLPARARRDAAVLYTYCRLVDDAVDRCEPAEQPHALMRLREELESVYANERQSDVRLRAFQELVRRVHLPRAYPEELLAGMAMDVGGTRYESLDQLLLYCYRVAGVVGLMMCHVLGVTDARALKNAAHLGIGMQLTNICRDVQEDWELGRLYLPSDLLLEASGGACSGLVAGPMPARARPGIAAVTRQLLEEAERFYASGDAGVPALPARAAFSVRAAHSIYHAIGGRVRAQQCDPLAPRAVVPARTKLFFLFRAALRTALELPRRLLARKPTVPLTTPCRFPDDILPV